MAHGRHSTRDVTGSAITPATNSVRRVELNFMAVYGGATKANSDPIPVCYCFGFDENHLREEIAQTGSTTIPDRISNLIREGLCACETRNPSGVCCLGEVNRIAKSLTQQLPVVV